MQREPDLTGFVENSQIPDLPPGPKSGISLTALTTTTTTILRPFFRDHQGETVPEVPTSTIPPYFLRA